MGLSRLVRLAFALAQTVFWTCLLLVMIAVQRLRKGAEAFQPRRRPRPACLDDPQLGTHQFATVAGVKLHYVEKGDKSKPLLLLVHGFPSFWYCWHHQLRDLSKDYWVVAVDMRGYGESDKPAGREMYARELVAGDLARLVAELGRTSCVVAAHDWGGIVAYTLAEKHPSVVDKLIIVNAPHMHDIRELQLHSWDQLQRSWYVFVFQLPWLGETMLGMDGCAALDQMFTRHTATPEQFPQDLVDAHKWTFGQPGALTPPLNYYRQNFEPTLPDKPMPPPLACPLLVLWGENDAALSPLLATMPARYSDNLKVRFVKNGSHWVLMEFPDQVNTHIRQFIEGKMQ